MNDKFYYHATDLFAVGEILRTGLKAGKDALIWLYNDIDATFGVCAMLDAKKMMNAEESLSDWRSFLYCGYGILKINRNAVTSEIVEDRNNDKQLFAVKQSIIAPGLIEYIGCYDFKSRAIIEAQIEKLDEVFLHEIKPIEETSRLVDNRQVAVMQNALFNAKRLSKVERNRNEQHRT